MKATPAGCVQLKRDGGSKVEVEVKCFQFLAATPPLEPLTRHGEPNPEAALRRRRRRRRQRLVRAFSDHAPRALPTTAAVTLPAAHIARKPTEHHSLVAFSEHSPCRRLAPATPTFELPYRARRYGSVLSPTFLGERTAPRDI